MWVSSGCNPISGCKGWNTQNLGIGEGLQSQEQEVAVIGHDRVVGVEWFHSGLGFSLNINILFSSHWLQLSCVTLVDSKCLTQLSIAQYVVSWFNFWTFAQLLLFVDAWERTTLDSTEEPQTPSGIITHTFAPATTPCSSPSLLHPHGQRDSHAHLQSANTYIAREKNYETYN